MDSIQIIHVSRSTIRSINILHSIDYLPRVPLLHTLCSSCYVDVTMSVLTTSNASPRA